MKLKIELEDVLHVVCCAICAFMASTILAHSTSSVLPCCLGGFLAGFCLGLGKEFGDYRASGNSWSWKDVLFDCIGAFIGCWGGFSTLLLHV